MDRVQLQELQIHKFRNFKQATVRPGERFNILTGQNGMGKTNLLEAIYQFGVLRSFRTQKRSELVLDGEGEARLKAIFTGVAAGMVCEITIGNKTRKLQVDGKVVPKVSEHFRRLPMVLFHPSTMAIVQGGPDMRRRFMDRALYQAEVTYPSIHRDYNKALTNRNLILKRKPVDKKALESFNPLLAEHGTGLMTHRGMLIEKIRPLFGEAFEDVSMGLEATIAYLPKVDGSKEDFLRILEEAEEVDIQRGFTTKGPHADDIKVEIDGRGARSFASQGQQRMIALALKIAETNVLALETSRIPILLLDDVSSELDREKNRQLFKFLEGVGGQVFITTTHLDYILTQKDRKDFLVSAGKVEEKT